MITVKLYGRNGNILFQIATCIATALRNGTTYCIPHQTVNPKIWKQPFADRFPFCRPNGGRIWEEPSHAYTPIPKEKNLILHGYFQSEKYFSDYRDEVIKALGFQWQPKLGIVSIHVRRGDYLQLQDKHPVVTLYYLDKSMSYFWELGYRKFKFFSDDIEWCKEHFSHSEYYLFSEGKTELQDMQEMSECEHHIISNSSFSWWGAWLNRNPRKIVICPSEKSWFGKDNAHLNTKDLCPESWIRMDY